MSWMAKLTEAIAAAALLGILFLVGTAWSSLPERVPVHFNFSGQPDRWGSKDTFGLLVLLALFSYGVLTAMRNKPQWLNVPFQVDKNAPEVRQIMREMTGVIKASILLMLLVVLSHSIAVAQGTAEGLGEGIIPMVILLSLGPMGFYLIKLYAHRNR
jgi:hypothetical protein